MSSCFGSRKPDRSDTQPLLAQYDETTALQTKVHAKLHTYQMLRALSKGYLPSTEQTTVQLRTLLAADVLNPTNTQLTADGRKFVRCVRRLITGVIELLREKNGQDQVQDLLWCVGRARVGLDTQDLVDTATSTKARADARSGESCTSGRGLAYANCSTAYDSLRTVFDLLLANGDFRKLVSDITTITRQVLADTASASATAALTVADTISPESSELAAITSTDTVLASDIPKDQAAEVPAREVANAVAEGFTDTVGETIDSARREFGKDDRKDALLTRMKMAVLRLRRNTDYTDSVSIISLLIKRYAYNYSRALDTTAAALGEDLQPNPELDRAVKSFGSLFSSFGERREWDELERRWERVMSHVHEDVEFERVMDDLGSCIQAFFTDPDFVSSAEDKLSAIREKIRGIGTEGTVRGDVDTLLEQVHTVYVSIINDSAVSGILATSRTIIKTLFPSNSEHFMNPNLTSDMFYVLLPLALKMIQFVPIPRLTVSAPEIDLLIENLILEPGDTINDSSFFPFRLRIESQNNVEIRKGLHRNTATLASFATIKIEGITMRADDVGYWFRLHKGLLRFSESGLAGFQMDSRGMDIHLDVEFGKDRVDKIVTLRDVRVKIHKLSYTLQKSYFSFAAWLFKPIIRRVLRKALEVEIAAGISASLKAANRELLFARERLRATRIAEPSDWRKFISAVITRLTPAENPDVDVCMGVLPQKGEGVFEGRRTPGSLVGLWEGEGERAGEIVDEESVGGWRNEVFDIHAALMT